QSKNAVSLADIPQGVLSPLQQDEDRFYATAVLSRTPEHLNVAIVLWRKEPLERWLARAKNRTEQMPTATDADYRLPSISAGTGCIDDTWTATADAPLGREWHTAVWTGTEMIIWGGFDRLNTGWRYNPNTDSWTVTSVTNAPDARDMHTAVWTGNEMIVWGGFNGNPLNTGGRYNPVTDTWLATTTTNAPSARDGHTAVWIGNEMIIWGGLPDTAPGSAVGGRYNPNTDNWIDTATVTTGRGYDTAVWTGTEMIVWGGDDETLYHVNSGGRYDPSIDVWMPTSTTNAPSARDSHTAIWT